MIYCSESGGKVRFDSKASAQNKIKGIHRNNHKTEKKPIRAYYCENCQGWHLTSKSKKKKKLIPLEKYDPRWDAILRPKT